MNKALVLCPKANSYYDKPLDTMRIMTDVYKQYFMILKAKNIKPIILIEDNIAMTFVEQVGIDDIEYRTCIAPSDIDFFYKYKGYINIPDDLKERYDASLYQLEDIERRYSVPPMLAIKDKAGYIDKRTTMYARRYQECIKSLISRYHIIMYFSAGSSQTDRCPSPRRFLAEGDGKFLFDITINGTHSFYYGGVPINRETVDMILDCEVF